MTRQGWDEYGFLNHPSPQLLSPRLQPPCTLHGLLARFALIGAKADERHALIGMLRQTLSSPPPIGRDKF